MANFDAKTKEILINPKNQIYTDKKSGFQTIAYPIQFSDGTNGILSITRLEKMPWQPTSHLTKVILQYK